MSKCGKCNGFSWEISEESPNGAKYKMYFVRCALCKSAIGVLPYYDINSQIETTQELVKTHNRTLLGAIETVNQNIARLFQLLQRK